MTWFINLRKERSCIECGEDRWYVLDFHHVNEKDDDYNVVSRLVSDRYSKKRILEEIEKCVCVCSNCHREIHHNKNKARVTELAKVPVC